MTIFVQNGKDRREVLSLAPFLRFALHTKSLMRKSLDGLRPELHCHWYEWGIGKGVTHVKDAVTIFATPQKLMSGLHAKLIQGFPNVDPHPLCYDPKNLIYGFGGFIRWVYFTDPNDAELQHGVFGIDWAPTQSIKLGVAPTMIVTSQIARIVQNHGIPSQAELALLNWQMVEPIFIRTWRKQMKLITLSDWCEKGLKLFGPSGVYCPVCGLRTFEQPNTYCFRCGNNRRQILQGDDHGLEACLW